MAFWNKFFNRRGSHAETEEKNVTEPQAKYGESALEKNPGLEVFDGVQSSILDILDRRSVTAGIQDGALYPGYANYFTSVFTGMSAMPVLTNKRSRIKQYREMAGYTECDFCINEIANDFVHEDDDGEVIHLLVPEKTHLNDVKRQILDDEFRKYIELFKLKENGKNLAKKFITEGEVAFENIINPEKPELGILGVRHIQTEYYETLVNPDTGRPIGIFFDKKNKDMDMRNLVSMSALGAQSIFNNMITASIGAYNKDECVPFLWPQLTYISSGVTSPDGLIQYPMIEKCKQAYHQLVLMQDAAVILRVTRAPERLLFNINTGNLNERMARAKIQDFANKMKSKRIVSFRGGNPQDAEQTTTYTPISMLESFYFGKTNANDGTTVESVGSTADYEQIADIEFFLRRLFKQFGVPFSRYKEPDGALEREDTISKEEYSFSRLIIDIQRRFASAFKNGYITHLKLRGIWKKYGLRENDFNVEMERPILYDLYNVNKMVTSRMETYKAITDVDELSKTIAMKKILKMSDEEVDENFRMLIKEKQYIAMTDYFGDLVSDEHYPLDYTSPIRLNGIDNQTGPEKSGGGEGEGGEEGGGGGHEDENPPENNEEEGGNDEENGEESPPFGLG